MKIPWEAKLVTCCSHPHYWILQGLNIPLMMCPSFFLACTHTHISYHVLSLSYKPHKECAFTSIMASSHSLDICWLALADIQHCSVIFDKLSSTTFYCVFHSGYQNITPQCLIGSLKQYNNIPSIVLIIPSLNLLSEGRLRWRYTTKPDIGLAM